jgi:hypothetical protein
MTTYTYRSGVEELASNKPNTSTAFNLSGTATAPQVTFASAFTNGQLLPYRATDLTGSAWEEGFGTFTAGSPNTLVRTRVTQSSNSDAAVDFSSAGYTTLTCAWTAATASAVHNGTLIQDATAKTTPVGADLLGLWDSVASALKSLSFTNLVEFLKTAFTTGIVTPKIYPTADSTTSFQVNKADGTTNVLNVDTTNGHVGIGTTSPTLGKLEVKSVDNYATTPFAIAVHEPNESPYLGGFFNDTKSTTVPLATYFGWNNGDFNMGTLLGKFFLGAGGSLISGSTVRMTIDNTNGRVGIGTTSPTGKLDVNDDHIRVRTAKTPASAGATGDAGDICWDSTYLYVCVATNTWVRALMTTF